MNAGEGPDNRIQPLSSTYFQPFDGLEIFLFPNRKTLFAIISNKGKFPTNHSRAFV